MTHLRIVTTRPGQPPKPLATEHGPDMLAEVKRIAATFARAGMVVEIESVDYTAAGEVTRVVWTSADGDVEA